jgi:dTDP-4-dehydrorhamnose 3,5-epimerase
VNCAELGIVGCYLVTPERHDDDRGFFARTYCQEEFTAKGLAPNMAQCSVSFNIHKHTLRGMHYQATPHAEAKLVRCTAGSIYDVVLDIRNSSTSYGRWIAAQLTAENHNALYIPEGCAHGFLTLVPNSEVYYQMSVPFEPAAGRGIRFDDPVFAIEWPTLDVVISQRDRDYPLWTGVEP